MTWDSNVLSLKKVFSSNPILWCRGILFKTSILNKINNFKGPNCFLSIKFVKLATKQWVIEYEGNLLVAMEKLEIDLELIDKKNNPQQQQKIFQQLQELYKQRASHLKKSYQMETER